MSLAPAVPVLRRRHALLPDHRKSAPVAAAPAAVACRCALALLTAAALRVPLPAQCSAGPFVGAPFALSFADGGAYPRHEALHKPVGFVPGNPAPWAGPTGAPVFSFGAAVNGCSGWLLPLPDIDSMSLGEDWILADDATGRVQVPQDRWAAITFSVTPATVGRPGSAIRRESGVRGGASADIFSFVLPGSAMPAPLVGVTERVHDSREIDVGPQVADLDSLDQLAALFASEPFVQASMQAPARWFFTVSDATKNAMHPFVWNGTTPSGATIFVMTWQSTGWSCPQIWRTYDQLGLTAAEDIDALAIDLLRCRMLFSTKTVTRDPILFLNWCLDQAAPVPYGMPDGSATVSEAAGLINDDDVDAVCGIDPSVRSGSGGFNGIGFTIGTPRPKVFVNFATAAVASSAFRVPTPGPADSSYRTFVSGWPNTGAGPGFAVLFLSAADQPLPLIHWAILARNPLDPVCGNPIATTVPVPDQIALRGVQFDLRWFIADQALTSIHEAYPIQVRL